VLQLRVEIVVTPGILETHFVEEKDLKIVLTSMGTTKSIRLLKMKNISAGSVI
jgi:hypothetical protein